MAHPSLSVGHRRTALPQLSPNDLVQCPYLYLRRVQCPTIVRTFSWKFGFYGVCPQTVTRVSSRRYRPTAVRPPAHRASDGHGGACPKILAMIAFSPEAGKAVDGVMPPSITGNTRLMNTPGAGPSGPSMKDWNSSALKGWEASQMQKISSCGMKRRVSADARAVAVRCRSGPCARCRSGGSNGCGRRWRDS